MSMKALTEQNKTVLDEPPFKWNEQREKAAALVAADELSDEAIAEECGVSRTTLHFWKRRSEFAARVAADGSALRAALLKHDIAKKHRRIAKLQKTIDRIEQLMDSRADVDAQREFYGAHEALPPGVGSGLLVGKTVLAGNGTSAVQWSADTALLKEYRATLEQAAKELGQLTEQIDIRQESLIRQYVGIDINLV